MPVDVHIDAEMLDDAKSMASETHQRFRESPGHYGNDLGSHFLGKVGEMACAEWTKNLGMCCDEVFRDLDRVNEADIILNLKGTRTIRIEVKSWSSHLWTPFGRCIPAGQIRDVCAKADIVLWCTVTPLLDVLQGNECNVQVEGWNTPTEIAEVAPTWTGPTGRQVCNHQVPMEQVRPLDQLVAMLLGEV